MLVHRETIIETRLLLRYPEGRMARVHRIWNRQQARNRDTPGLQQSISNPAEVRVSPYLPQRQLIVYRRD